MARKAVGSHRQHYATKLIQRGFAPRNVVVKHDVMITPIIDWDSDWFPQYQNGISHPTRWMTG